MGIVTSTRGEFVGSTVWLGGGAATVFVGVEGATDSSATGLVARGCPGEGSCRSINGFICLCLLLVAVLVGHRVDGPFPSR